MSITDRQELFCKAYVKTREVQSASLEAGYSKSYSKTKAYLLLKDDEVKKRVAELEEEYYQDHFKKLSLRANEELENILVNGINENAKLKAIEMVYKLSGLVKDEKITINQNNATVQTNSSNFKVKTLDDFYVDIDTKGISQLTDSELLEMANNEGIELDDPRAILKDVVIETLDEFEKEY